MGPSWLLEIAVGCIILTVGYDMHLMSKPSMYSRNVNDTRKAHGAPLKKIEYGVYGDLILICPKLYSIYFRGTIYSF